MTANNTRESKRIPTKIRGTFSADTRIQAFEKIGAKQMNDPILLIEHGRLTGEPELKTTKTGKQILQFTVAGNGSHKDKQTGQYVDDCQILSAVPSGILTARKPCKRYCTRVVRCVWRPLSITLARRIITDSRACISMLDSRRLPCIRPVRRSLSNSRRLTVRPISTISAIVTLGVRQHFENQNANV